MISKKTGFCFLFVLAAALGIKNEAFSQTGSPSPYSRYGIGDIITEGFTHQSGMGGIGAGLASPFNINFINPASYVVDSVIVFEFGARGEVTQLKKSNVTSTQNSASFSHMSLGFPIKRGKISAVFGLLPYSTVGYNIQVDERNVPDIGTIRYRYEGNGGFNKFFVGTGIRISKSLNAGINVSYLFGTIENIKSVEFPEGNNYFNSRYINAVTAKGFHFNYGIQHEKKTVKGMVIRSGITGAVSTKVNAYNNRFYYNYTISAFGGEITKDSVFNETEVKGKIKMPWHVRGGVTFERPGKWLAGADVGYTNWENYSSFGVKDSLKNSFQVGIGGERHTNRFVYRLGARYATTYLNLNETQLQDYALTLGIGLKRLFPKRPPSSITVAVEIGQRGTEEKNLIKEQYVRFHLGFTLADIWFIQPKYD